MAATSKHYVKIFAGIYSSLGDCYIMFYQNSNDLVKHASVSSGHVQNSNATREVLLKQPFSSPIEIGGANDIRTSSTSSTPNDSLTIGSKFQNMVKGLIDTVSMKEGLTETDKGGDQTQYVNDIADDSRKYSEQEISYNQKLIKTMDFLDQKNPTNPRVTWAEVSDSDGNTKYGYITKDGIFQIWHAPGRQSDNWIQSDKMKSNTSVIGCPRPETMKKMKIAGTWDSIKPYDMVYSESDSGRKNPLFMLVNPNVRDPRNSHDRKGLFSCGNERGNVYVSERPSADFNTSSTLKNGCYIVKHDSKGGSVGFTPQNDLGDASISQCKRRAEDLGSSHFFLAPSENQNQPNQGKCWVYTGNGTPDVTSLLRYDETGAACHRVNNPETDEDGFMKAYPTTTLPRMYGKKIEIPIEPIPNPNCDHTRRDGCIFDNYKHLGNGYCVPSVPRWAYAGLYNYSNDQFKEWLKKLHARNGSGIERAAVDKYIENCKGTKGYTFLDDNYVNPTRQQVSVGLYSLKTGGPTGVNKGAVGKLAYIDHNGEKHEYPPSALSYKANIEYETKPSPPCPYGWWQNGNECLQICSSNSSERHSDGTCICDKGGHNQNCYSAFKCVSNSCKRAKPGSKTENGESISYVTMDGYDTRSAESSYGVKETKVRNKFPLIANMPNWEMVIQFRLDGGNGGGGYETQPSPPCPDGWWQNGNECLQICSSNKSWRHSDGTCICEKGFPNQNCYSAFKCVSNSCKRDKPGVWRPLIGNMYNDIVTGRGWGLWISPQNKIHWSWKYNTADFDLKIEIRVVYQLTIINSPTTMSMVLKNMSKGTEQKQTLTKPNNAVMATEGPVTVGGWKKNPNEKFPGRIISVSIPKMYIVDYPPSNGADIPLSNPVPVDGSVSGTVEQCRQMCNNDEKCGGFVYTKGAGTPTGRCELKDRTKMYPVGLRVTDPTKQLMLKVPNINDSIKDSTCKVGNGIYTMIDTAQYAHYPSGQAMSSDSKCDMKGMIPKDGSLQMPNVEPVVEVTETAFQETQQKTAEYRLQSQGSSESTQLLGLETGAGVGEETFTTLREGLSYVDTMKDVNNNLTKIAKSEYQRERLIALSDESNRVLISESYKFILWSILAILVVLAVIKLKEMFGQDDADDADDDSSSGGSGLFASILGLFSIGKVDTSDIADRTGDVKNALSSAGNQLKEGAQQLSTSITEGADNLVSSANQAAMGAMESARGFADRVSETATDAVNRFGDEVSGNDGGGGATTGGKRTHRKK